MGEVAWESWDGDRGWRVGGGEQWAVGKGRGERRAWDGDGEGAGERVGWGYR